MYFWRHWRTSAAISTRWTAEYYTKVLLVLPLLRLICWNSALPCWFSAYILCSFSAFCNPEKVTLNLTIVNNRGLHSICVGHQISFRNSPQPLIRSWILHYIGILSFTNLCILSISAMSWSNSSWSLSTGGSSDSFKSSVGAAPNCLQGHLLGASIIISIFVWLRWLHTFVDTLFLSRRMRHFISILIALDCIVAFRFLGWCKGGFFFWCPLLFQKFSSKWNCWIDWVANDVHEGIRTGCKGNEPREGNHAWHVRVGPKVEFGIALM